MHLFLSFYVTLIAKHYQIFSTLLREHAHDAMSGSFLLHHVLRRISPKRRLQDIQVIQAGDHTPLRNCRSAQI